MKNFTYYQPKTVAQAIALLDTTWGKTELLAGGTDLHDLQKEYVAQPDKLVSLSGVAGLGTIDVERLRVGTSFKIWAGVKLAAIASHAELKKLAPGLTTAVEAVGGPQIRNMGTLGGNLCQRNRCWYFRDEHVKCLLKGGDKCFALPVDAENRYHAIFTQGHKCVMVHPSTVAPMLIALGATAHVQGSKGERTVALKDLYHAPSGPDQREHTVAPNEVLTAVSFTVKPESVSGSYEVRQKLSPDWPLVQATVSYGMKGGKNASDVMVVVGHVAPVPHVSEAAAKALEGKDVTDETAAAAGKAAAQGAKPLGQNGYKVRLVEVAVKRAILAAAGKKYWE